jgi:intracellular septation protein A
MPSFSVQGVSDNTGQPMATPPPGIKHWRNFGPAEWGHVREGLLGMVLGTLLPVVLFYVTLKTISFPIAILVALGWSASIFIWHLRRTGGADVFSASTFVLACVKASAGLLSDNLTLYLAWPSLENMIYATAFFGSALLGKPLLALYAQRLYPIPREVRRTSVFKNAFLVVSAAWFVGHSLRAMLRLYLLNTLPLELFLLADTVAGWPISAALIAITTLYPLRQLQRAGLILQPQPITSMDVVELAVEESAPSTV